MSAIPDLTGLFPSGGVLGLIALVIVLTFVLIISLKSKDPGTAAVMVLLALRGKVPPARRQHGRWHPAGRPRWHCGGA